MTAFESLSYRSLSIVLTVFCLLTTAVESFTFTTSNLHVKKFLSTSDRNSFFKHCDIVSSSSTRLAALKEGAYERIAELREELAQLGNYKHQFTIYDILELG
jgi:hypothetical protein